MRLGWQVHTDADAICNFEGRWGTSCSPHQSATGGSQQDAVNQDLTLIVAGDFNIPGIAYISVPFGGQKEDMAFPWFIYPYFIYYAIKHTYADFLLVFVKIKIRTSCISAYALFLALMLDYFLHLHVAETRCISSLKTRNAFNTFFLLKKCSLALALSLARSISCKKVWVYFP